MLPFYENQPETNRIFFAKNIQFPLHLHQEIELVYVIKGQLLMNIEQKQYILTEGMLGVIFPHCIHDYQFSEHDVKIFIINYQSLSDFHHIFTNFYPENPIITRPSNDLIKFLKQTNQEKQLNNLRHSLLLRANWYMIFALCVNELELIERSSFGKISLTKKIILYVADHFKEPLSLATLAEQCNCSEFTISKIFSKQIGVNFPTYLTQLRLEYAKKLLETSTDSILTIAFEAGFDSQRNFNRSFHRFEGITPSSYRKSKKVH